MRNPFSAGSWVSGPDFFGRESIISGLLSSNEKCDWVIAQRRMGKTSLLRKLEEQFNSGLNEGLAVFWDIQGSYDADGLLESLEDALEDSFDLFPDHWGKMSPQEFKGLPPHQVIKSLARKLRQDDKKMTLLIDEAEEFITLTQKTPESLSRLRKTFHTCPNLHTIICSTPRLEKLLQMTQIDTSPFLHGFHSHFLGGFTRQETQDLLKNGHIESEIADEVFQLAFGNPYQTQLFAKFFFEYNDYQETINFLHSNPSLAQVHEVNLGLLTEEEKLFLLNMSSPDAVLPKNNTESMMAHKLTLIGYLKFYDQKYSIASQFFGKWLTGYFNLNIDKHPHNEQDFNLASAPKSLVKFNILSLYRYLLQQCQEGYRVPANPELFKISGMDKKIYPIKDLLVLEENPDHTSQAWQVAATDLIALIANTINLDEDWSCFRLKELIQNITNCEESALIDLMLLIREESCLDEIV